TASRRCSPNEVDLRALAARPSSGPSAPHGAADTGDPAGAAPLAAAASAGDRRTGPPPPLHEPLYSQLRRGHRLLPARLLHDEAQPARERAARRAPRVPRPPSARRRGAEPGRASPLPRAAG